ncbi:hypothetical protein D3C73_1313280 [compost metagenome]
MMLRIATAILIKIRLYHGSAVSGSLSPPSGEESGSSSSSTVTPGSADGVGELPAAMLPESGEGVAWPLSPPPSGTGASVTVTSSVSGVAVTVGVADGAGDDEGG